MYKINTKMTFAAFSVLLCLGAAADSRMPGDPVVEAVRSAYTRAGRVQPFTSFPVTEDELRRAAAELARDPALGDNDRAALEKLVPPEPEDRIEADLDLSYVRYSRTEENYIEDYDNKNGIDLYRLYLSEPPPVRFSLGWEGANGLFLRGEAALRKELDETDFFGYDNFWELGQEENPVAIENHDFVRGILGWTGNGFRFTFGRERVHFGPETFSSLLVSDRIPYLDSVRASIPFGPFRMDWYVATIPAFEIDSDLPDPDPAYYGYYRTENQTIIVDALHRFEWRGAKARAAVSGNVTYVRANNYFEASDFFPVLSWHENGVRPNNMRLVLDASWCFLPGWTVSGQAGFDDINAGMIGVGDSSVPTVDAYILAVRWDGGTAERRMGAVLEGGYTHYLWGSFDENETSGDPSSGTLARAVYRLRVNSEAQALPLTSPYGPGALWLRGSFDLPNLTPDMSLNLGVLVLSKNTEADLLNTPFENDPAVANAPRILYIEASASARYIYKAFTFALSPLLAVRDGEVWAELALDASYALDFGARVKKL